MSQPSSPPSSLEARRTSPGPADWSRAQRQRRSRILDATIDLALVGGYDAVQMRTVADRAHVALGTLYRYFPSKTHLLVATMRDQIEQIWTQAKASHLRPGTSGDRVLHLMETAMSRDQATQALTAALIRAYYFASRTDCPEVVVVDQLVIAILCETLGELPARTTTNRADVAGILADVWMSTTVGWVTGRLTLEGYRQRRERAVRMLLSD